MDEIFEEEYHKDTTYLDYEIETFGVYVKVDENSNVIAVDSDFFIEDFDGWIKIDEGHDYQYAGSNYFNKPLLDEYDRYNYKLVDGEVVEIEEQDKPVYQPYTYKQLVEHKIRTRYTVSDELAILRQRDIKPQEFEEYNAFCEQCKVEAKQELGITGV